MPTEVWDILMRLVAAGVLGAGIGFERRVHHKAIGIAGMVLIAIGSTTYMLLGRHLAELDPSSISRTLGVSYPGSASSGEPAGPASRTTRRQQRGGAGAGWRSHLSRRSCVTR